jgi:N-methylhydantoinase A
MQSNGGVTSAAQAAKRVVSTLFSGPVGGTVAAEAIARQMDAGRLVCVDMGGTSFDVSLVIDGAAEVESQFEIAGHPILAPKVSVSSLGAGGGSIAYVESGGLRVGPESAGAYPGPACYARGGSRPTVTDANLLLGRIPPAARLGGTVALDHAAAAAAIAPVAADLGLEPVELAAGIVSVTNAKMADAIREITIARGIDPRDFDLLAFGGAGPLHAAALAEELEIERVVVPTGPGTLSAWGMLQAPVRHDLVQAFLRSLHALDADELARAVSELRRRGEEALRNEGAGGRRARIEASADLRYQGQEYTLNVPLPEPLGTDPLSEVAQRFEDAHRFRYGHANPSEAIEIVSLRVAAAGLADPVPVSPLATLAPPEPATIVQTVFDRVTYDTPVYAREPLGAGIVLDGPCIVLEDGCTTLVPPTWRAATTGDGHLVLQRREEQ